MIPLNTSDQFNVKYKKINGTMHYLIKLSTIKLAIFSCGHRYPHYELLAI